MKPAAMAAQRRARTTSRRSRAANTEAKMGMVKSSAVAVASGISVTARNQSAMPKLSSSARTP